MTKVLVVSVVIASLLMELCAGASQSRSPSESRSPTATSSPTTSPSETRTSSTTNSKTRTATVTRSRSETSSATTSRTQSRSASATPSISFSITPAPSPNIVDAQLSGTSTTLTFTVTFSVAGQRQIIRLHTGSNDAGGDIVSYRVATTPVSGAAVMYIKRGAIPDPLSFDASATDASGVNAITMTNTNAVHYIVFVALNDACVADVAITQIATTAAPPSSTPSPAVVADWVWAIVAVAGFLLLLCIVLFFYFCCCRGDSYGRRVIVRKKAAEPDKKPKKKPKKKGAQRSPSPSLRSPSPTRMLIPRSPSPQFIPVGGPQYVVGPGGEMMLVPVSQPFGAPYSRPPPPPFTQSPSPSPTRRPVSIQEAPAPQDRRASPPPQSLPPQVVQQQQRRQLAQQLEQQQPPLQSPAPQERAASPTYEAQTSPRRNPAPSLAPFLPPSTARRPEESTSLQRQLDQQQQELDLQRKLIIHHRDEHSLEVERLRAQHDRELRRERDERMEEDARRTRRMDDEKRRREEALRDTQRLLTDQREREKEREQLREREREYEQELERERRERDRKRERDREQELLATIADAQRSQTLQAELARQEAERQAEQQRQEMQRLADRQAADLQRQADAARLSAPFLAPTPGTLPPGVTPPSPPVNIELPGLPYKCIQTFTPNNTDEIPMFENDHIRVLEVFDDGWGRAMRSGGATGMVPMNMLAALPLGTRPPTAFAPPPPTPPGGVPQTVVVYQPPPPPKTTPPRGPPQAGGNSGDSWNEDWSQDSPTGATGAPLLGSRFNAGRQPPRLPPAARAQELEVREMRAVQAYLPTRQDEMPLAVGDNVTVLKRHPDGWGRVRGPQGKEGLVPLNHLVPRLASSGLGLAPVPRTLQFARA